MKVGMILCLSLLIVGSSASKLSTKAAESHLGCTESAVLKLEPETFASTLGGSRHFLLYYVPSCVHSRSFMPIFESFAEAHKSEIQSVSVDCGTHHHFCHNLEIWKYPSIYLVDGTNAQEYTGGPSHDEMLYFIKTGKTYYEKSPSSPLLKYDEKARHYSIVPQTPRESAKRDITPLIILATVAAAGLLALLVMQILKKCNSKTAKQERVSSLSNYEFTTLAST